MAVSLCTVLYFYMLNTSCFVISFIVVAAGFPYML